MDKKPRGGSRPGSGRPTKKATVVKTYRCYPEEVDPIKAAIKAEVNRLRSVTPTTRRHDR